jgi:TRAP-type C4-dicarboxylate transport system substrate-binding protein
MQRLAPMLCSVLIFSAGAFATTVSAEQKLTYASYLPAGHIIHTDGLQPYFEEITRATDGALTFELFPGGAMGGGKAMLSVVRDRIVDSAIIIDLYVKRDLPASSSITELALLGEDTMVMAGAVNELQLLDCDACEQERLRNDVVGLAYYATSPFYLMCNTPVETLADVEGLKVRAIGPWGFWVQAMGGVPVSLTSAEIYEALQRGQVDCTFGSPAWLTSYNLVDVVTDIVDLPMGTYHGAMVFDMNLDSWNDLSAEQRTIIKDGLPGLSRRIVESYDRDDATARELAVEKGIEWVTTDPAMKDLLAEHRQSEFERVVAKAEEEGVENARELAEKFAERVEEWSRLVAEIGHDPDRYEQLLRDRLFSRLD